MLSKLKSLFKGDDEIQSRIEKTKNSNSLLDLVGAAFRLGLAVAATAVEDVLNERGRAPDEAPVCPECGQRLVSKGLAPRKMTTLVGVVQWKRRVYRCRKGCRVGLVAPSDERLGIRPFQQTCDKLKMAAATLAVLVPFDLAAWLLKNLLEVEVCAGSIWNWVQRAGEKAGVKIENDLKKLRNGSLEKVELDAETALLPMIVGADGVNAPFRPNEGTPKGKTVWKEVKIGVVARIGSRLTKGGKTVSVLVRRRLAAVLGGVDEFKPILWAAAKKEGAEDAPEVVWISDGGPGFWRLFRESFSRLACGVLDFYHAAQNIWKGAQALFGPSETKARRWFSWIRGLLREGKAEDVLEQIQLGRTFFRGLSDAEKKTLDNLIAYLEEHLEHIDYERFKKNGWPIGSGMVESACKWLIQQRFKCVGMRWSVEGFANLLWLRLAWVNGDFSELFDPMPSPIF